MRQRHSPFRPGTLVHPINSHTYLWANPPPHDPPVIGKIWADSACVVVATIRYEGPKLGYDTDDLWSCLVVVAPDASVGWVHYLSLLAIE